MKRRNEPVQSHHKLVHVEVPNDPQPHEAAGSTSSGPSKPNSILTISVGPVTHEQRLQMIAEAAYFIAEHRGFEPGHDMDDWIAAEGEVNAMLAQGE